MTVGAGSRGCSISHEVETVLCEVERAKGPQDFQQKRKLVYEKVSREKYQQHLNLSITHEEKQLHSRTPTLSKLAVSPVLAINGYGLDLPKPGTLETPVDRVQ